MIRNTAFWPQVGLGLVVAAAVVNSPEWPLCGRAEVAIENRKRYRLSLILSLSLSLFLYLSSGRCAGVYDLCDGAVEPWKRAAGFYGIPRRSPRFALAWALGARGEENPAIKYPQTPRVAVWNTMHLCSVSLLSAFHIPLICVFLFSLFLSLSLSLDRKSVV